MNASVVGFITSIVIAAAITSSSPTWAGLMGASSMARTLILDTYPRLTSESFGNTPYAVEASPTRIKAIPTHMAASGVFPARM